MADEYILSLKIDKKREYQASRYRPFARAFSTLQRAIKTA